MESHDPSPQACPPPLMWQDVRREYLAQSESRSISSPHGTANVRILGAGASLYLLPSFAAPAELFCLLFWLLRDEFRCVTVERDWTNLTNRTAAPSLEHDADLLWAVADELGDATMDVCGANYGAAWGLAAAQRQPGRISRLILLEGFLHRRLSFFERQLAWICGWSRRTLASVPGREFLQMQNQRRWFPPFDQTRWQYFLDATGEMPLNELSRRARAISRFDLRSAAGEIKTPTLVIHTEGDSALAETGQLELERRLPNVQSEWLHNTGQLAYLTHPHRMAKLIRGFCTNVGHVSNVPEKSDDPDH